MSLLQSFRVVQIGHRLAVAVCGRLLADVGADVGCIDPGASTPLAAYLNHGKSLIANDLAAQRNAIAAADLSSVRGGPKSFAL